MIEVPEEYLLGKVTAHDQINPHTGELICECNKELTTELLQSIRVFRC